MDVNREKLGFFKRLGVEGILRGETYHWITNEPHKTIGREDSFPKLLNTLNGYLNHKIDLASRTSTSEFRLPLYDVFFGTTESAGELNKNERGNIIGILQTYNERALAFLALKGSL